MRCCRLACRKARCIDELVAGHAPMAHLPRLIIQPATPLHPTQMTWLLDGQPYFTARSRTSCGGGGWYSDGPGAGPHAPFDKVCT